MNATYYSLLLFVEGLCIDKVRFTQGVQFGLGKSLLSHDMVYLPSDQPSPPPAGQSGSCTHRGVELCTIHGLF